MWIIVNNSTNKNINAEVNAKNVYFDLGNNRRIISDNMHLQYENNITTAQLEYAGGSAGFKLQNETFHLYGNKFNDQ